MENDERWCSNGDMLRNVVEREAPQPILDPASGSFRTATVRQRMNLNSSVPSISPQQILQQRPMTRSSDFVSRGSDDDVSNLSSCYHDDSSLSSDDNALRDRGNGVHRQKLLAAESFVPEGNPLAETGFMFKGIPDSVGTVADNELHQQVPLSKYEELELRILRQPEEQHRARYMSEGSRGSVKDRSGKSHCTVALRGYYRPAILEIFAAIGSGAAVPHPLYRLIPVTGKNGSSVTTCKEAVTADGASCLQVVLRPETKMNAVLDCIGILKICSYDLKRKLPKQSRSASVRLVFRVTVPSARDRRQNVTLQTVSMPIVCAQQPGYPDVSRISCTSAPVEGNVDVFIVGKNFSNNSTVTLKEYGPDGKLVWTAAAMVDQQHVHTCHMICTIPPYRDLYIGRSVEVMLTVECGKKVSRPISFKYLSNSTIAVPTQGQQQMAYSTGYALNDLGGASSSSRVVQQPELPKYGDWTPTDFNTTVQPVQQQYQQQQAQQQPLLAPAATDQQSFPLSLTAPSVTIASNVTDFADASTAGAKLEPVPDEQSAEFYYSNQFSEKPPTTKRNSGEDVFMTNDPFTFALEDFPQLLT